MSARISFVDRSEILFEHKYDPVTRRIYFTDTVEPVAVERVVKGIHLLSTLGSRPITLWISSPGGDLDAAFFLYDVIQANNVPINTVGAGEICSAATLILAAGKKRAATAHAFCMAHDASMSEVTGDHDEIKAQFGAFRRQRDLMFALLEQHTKLTAVEWKAKTKAKGQVWLTTDQMFQYGIVDGVIVPSKSKRSNAKA